MGATIVAFLKALPAAVKILSELKEDFRDFKDSRDDARFEEYKQEVNKQVERLKHAKDKAETARIIADLNSL